MKKPFTMNRFLLFIVTMMVCASGYAANYFERGTEWKYKEFENGQLCSTTVELVDVVDADGAPCYQEVRKSIVTDSSGNPVSDEVKTINGWLVKVDGEKVYLCSPWVSETQWQLVYDFSLQPGEGCLIKETQLFSGEIRHEVYFKFIGMTKIKDYDVEVMELKVFWSEEESGDDSNAIDTQYWIPGVGSTFMFDGRYRYRFPDEEPAQYLYTSTLLKVTDAEGDVVVEYRENSGIATVEAENADAPAAYYDLSGRRVANPGHGLYILRQGAKAAKVIL